jgi:hypothetical protein
MYRMEQQEGRWVAVHVPSEHDQGFHVFEPPVPEVVVEELGEEKVKKEPIQLHPPGPRPKWMVNVKRLQDQREKERKEREGSK